MTTKSTAESGKRIEFSAKGLIIDKFGVSGVFSGDNIFPLKEGITDKNNAWAYSLDHIEIQIETGEFVKANFNGKILLPITNASENKNIKNEYFEKVKRISDNQYYLKTIDFFEYLSKETENIKEDGNPKLIKQKIDEITQKMDEIDKILDDKNLLEKYRISDEEAYSDQLTFFMVGGILKVFTGDTEGMVNDFINKIANKKISKEVAEYNQNKEIITALLIKMTLAFKEFSEEAPKEGKNFEKLIKRLDETEMYKRININSANE